MTSTDAFIAANRFGFGPKPGELDEIDRSPRRWVENQLRNPVRFPDPVRHLESNAEIAARLEDMVKDTERGDQEVRRKVQMAIQQVYKDETASRIRAAVVSPTPYIERLVHFWSNHFTVSTSNRRVAAHAGAFEREVIRPNVLGKFEDMLIASSKHPAMLIYLDNAQSIGPNSRVGSRSGRGLNENLAREILELHTLGVDGGYSQNDVIALAKIITGWSTRRPTRNATVPAGYQYRDNIHEPGDHVLLGKTYKQRGEAQGEAALRDIAKHDSTARFVATKLARHFSADEPSSRLVTRLERIYKRTDGDLLKLAAALAEAPEVWREPLNKVRNPTEYIISLLRATGLEPNMDSISSALQDLGHMAFTAPSPKGWPDTAEAWIAPESLMRRIELANEAARRMKTKLSPLELAKATIGPVADPDTLKWIDAAPDPEAGYTLALAAPEAQRR